MIKHVLLCSSGASRGQGTRSAEEMGHEGEQSALAKPLATSRTDSPSCRLMPNLRTSRFRRQWLQLSCCLSCDHQASSCHFLCTMYVRSKQHHARACARALGHKCKRTNTSTNANGLTHTEARVLTDGVACPRARTHVHTSESLTVVVV